MTLNRLIKMTTPLALVLMSSALQASTVEEFYKLFRSGHYPKALEALQTLPAEKNKLGIKNYLEGLSYSRLQEYDKAILSFEAAIKDNNDSIDLYYEYGQALYAANEFKKSRTAFMMSAQKQFNRSASLYYVAHISQILEDYSVAREYYTQVLKEKTSDTKMKQIAQFQLSETLLLIAREKPDASETLSRRVENFVLPMMNTALALDRSSTLAAEISHRKAEIMGEFNLDPEKLINGRRISAKRYSGYVSQKIRFDNNISLTNEENNVQQSKKESYIFETEAYAKYDYIAKKRFVISPEARFTFTEHGDQSTPEVYTNDSFVMNFSLKNKYEHKAFNQPASLLFDIDYTHTLKDWKAIKKKEFYAKSVNFTIGESFSYFDIGDTTVKLKRRNYSGENESISNHTTILSADQTFFLPIQHLLIALFEASYIDNFNNTSSNTDTYLLRFDYIIPQVMPLYTLGLGFATTLTDTKEQELTRGTELSFNPSIDFARELGERSEISVNYDYTKSKSKDVNYSYNKHVFTTEYRYSF